MIMDSAKRKRHFDILDLPVELRNLIYHVLLDQEHCYRLEATHGVEPHDGDDDTREIIYHIKMGIMYRTTRRSFRAHTDLLQTCAQIRNEVLRLLLKSSPRRIPIADSGRLLMEDNDVAYSHHQLAFVNRFSDVPHADVVEMCYDKADPTLYDIIRYNEPAGRLRKPLSSKNFLAQVSSLRLDALFFPAISPWSNISMVELASLPKLCPNLVQLQVVVSIRGLMACLDIYSTNRSWQPSTGPTKKKNRRECPLKRNRWTEKDMEAMTLDRILSIPAMGALSDLRNLRRFHVFFDGVGPPCIPWPEPGKNKCRDANGCRLFTAWGKRLQYLRAMLQRHYRKETMLGVGDVAMPVVDLD